MAMPWQFHGNGTAMPWHCHDGSVMTTPWQYHGNATSLPWQCRGNAMAVPWHGTAHLPSHNGRCRHWALLDHALPEREHASHTHLVPTPKAHHQPSANLSPPLDHLLSSERRAMANPLGTRPAVVDMRTTRKHETQWMTALCFTSPFQTATPTMQCTSTTMHHRIYKDAMCMQHRSE